MTPQGRGLYGSQAHRWQDLEEYYTLLHTYTATDARTDGRRLDYHTISSPCEPSAELKRVIYIFYIICTSVPKVSLHSRFCDNSSILDFRTLTSAISWGLGINFRSLKRSGVLNTRTPTAADLV